MRAPTLPYRPPRRAVAALAGGCHRSPRSCGTCTPSAHCGPSSNTERARLRAAPRLPDPARLTVGPPQRRHATVEVLLTSDLGGEAHGRAGGMGGQG